LYCIFWSKVCREFNCTDLRGASQKDDGPVPDGVLAQLDGLLPLLLAQLHEAMLLLAQGGPALGETANRLVNAGGQALEVSAALEMLLEGPVGHALLLGMENARSVEFMQIYVNLLSLAFPGFYRINKWQPT
jgi:hypothetical protein